MPSVIFRKSGGTLKKRIIGDGGLQVRPFVKKVSAEKYVVREGNRRLTVLRQILNDIDAGKLRELIPERFEAIDCIVYPEDITEKHVALHLNNIHVNGVKEWDAWVKAGTAYVMTEELGCTEDQVKKVGKKFIPKGVNYDEIQGLSAESKTLLKKVSPQTVGQASRIAGIRPTDITLIGVFLQKKFHVKP